MHRGSGNRAGRSSWNPRGGGNRSGRGRSFQGRNDRHHPRREGVQQNRRFSSSRSYGPPQTDHLDRIEEIGVRTENSVSIAIEGCCHGELEAIYERLRRYEQSETEAPSDAAAISDDIAAQSPNELKEGEKTREKEKKIDLLICCGDFQSLRTPADFHSLAVPAKYRIMGAFHKYYNGDWVAPVLTIFCGGNHEASQPLSELYYGGWVAPRMYYLGAAGVVRYKGIRIGGVSGIYKSHDYYKSRNEMPPYDANQLRSIYHYRNVDVFRLACLTTPGAPPLDAPLERKSADAIERVRESKCLDIMVSHDWPQGIEQHGDVMDLVRRKPFFRQEINDNSLGSPPLSTLLHELRPSYWFAAHLHVKFKATVVHPRGLPSERNNNSREPSETSANKPPKMLVPTPVVHASMIDNALLDGFPISEAKEEPEKEAASGSTVNDATEIPRNDATTQFVVPESSNPSCGNAESDLTELMTRFLSLDKCLPRRQYLSILHLPASGTSTSANDNMDHEEAKLEYDLEWLAIVRKTHHLAASTHFQRVRVPSLPLQVNEADMAWITERVGPDRTIPENFVPTLPEKYEEGQGAQFLPPPLPRMGNPQTDQLLELLQLEHLPNLTIPYSEQQSQSSLLEKPTPPQPVFTTQVDFIDEDEIDLDGDGANEEPGSAPLLVDTQHDVKKPRLDLDAPVA